MRFGITLARERTVRTSAEPAHAARNCGDRIALKLLSNRFTYKSDVGGMAVSLSAADGIRTCIARCAATSRPSAASHPTCVHEMASGGGK